MNPNDEGLNAIAERLERERPTPQPAFRRAVRRRLVELSGRRPVASVRRKIFAYAFAGVLLLFAAALGIAGLGPLAA